MSAADVMAAQQWRTNGHLIAEGVVPFYLDRSMRILDLTNGRGTFWKEWQPDELVRMFNTVGDPRARGDVAGDFTAAPFPDSSFDVVVFDPPYMPKGTPAGWTMDERYGTGSQRPAAIVELGMAGINEAVRIVKPGGLVLHKTGRGIDGAKLFTGDDTVTAWAQRRHNLRVVNQWRYLSRPRPQSHRGPQQTPRQNYSTLTLFAAPKVKRSDEFIYSVDEELPELLRALHTCYHVVPGELSIEPDRDSGSGGWFVTALVDGER
ncbi:MAG: hypothetical protein IPH81_17575 [Candidatus Microthrix sp.]|uniref:Methyltransferase n=1 Tax=Candidatus Neomicrothrix subdominans TaxID=2954438 RepID=A0A936NB69_9ACTN|nr:hypothetical protein [Candidatus Microthrix sp.]MBK9296755.1 hypothetical protein [Candidatus Microthrix subdominans]